MSHDLTNPENTCPNQDPDTASEIIRGLTGLRDTLASGKKLHERFTMRTVELDLEPRQFSPEEVRALRESLRASQAVFAKLIGVSVSALQAWEQGNPVSPMARRLLEFVERDREEFLELLRSSASARTE